MRTFISKKYRQPKGFIFYILYFVFSVALISCGGHKIPENFWESDELPQIYPDYADVTVPVNMAPLTFQMDGKADDVVARLVAGGEEIVCGGHKIQPGADDWKRLVGLA